MSCYGGAGKTEDGYDSALPLFLLASSLDRLCDRTMILQDSRHHGINTSSPLLTLQPIPVHPLHQRRGPGCVLLVAACLRGGSSGLVDLPTVSQAISDLSQGCSMTDPAVQPTNHQPPAPNRNPRARNRPPIITSQSLPSSMIPPAMPSVCAFHFWEHSPAKRCRSKHHS